ncbi:zinc finger BED domain-containing protein RICESLEEPER 2-like [Manihot esculenta]|uniref:zinc finger BED domain-containing protein RICESLEEPER 2-like n=1 Tax=Manihot esculenta TaxID=3983 RepID=UPI000B5D304B|nr:zinc finger BED domain-containing protein RICESLEEPER 2-like [Manihot esculenta]
MAIESCLLNWGIKRVFTITVDNASSNVVAISYLKKKINAWGFSILNCKYLHMRCIAHIINLVVVDGMKDGLTPIKKVRDAVRYIRQSPARLQRFKACCEMEGIQSKSSLCLDVSTRWNSTYLMLSSALKFENAFDRYATVDPYFKIDLQSCEGDGVPDSLEWEYIGKFVEFLGHFYELTLRISGSRCVTSNIFFDEISSIDCLLQEWKSSNDLELSCMGEKMKLKFDKYWGDPDKMNKIIYIAVVVDPRYKLEFMHFALSTMYGKEKRIFQSENANEHIGNVSESIEEGTKKKPRMRLGHQFMQHKIEIGEAKIKSDLDSYLNEDILILDEKEDFDILKWWKMNANM